MNAGWKARHRRRRCMALMCLSLLTPWIMGGCPEFRTDLVGVLATATRSALFGTDDALTIGNTARASFFDATLDLIFSVLEGDNGT